MKVNVVDLQGNKAKSVTVSESVFGVEPNFPLIAQALHIYKANNRKHTANAKTRAEVRGGGRKPWRQKGTGRARQGSIRSPQWAVGGVVFGPQAVQKRNMKLTKKMRNHLYCSLLSLKNQLGQVLIVQDVIKEPKTKEFYQFLSALGIQEKKVLFYIDDKSYVNVRKAAGNITNCFVNKIHSINAQDIADSHCLLLTEESLKGLNAKFVSKGK